MAIRPVERLQVLSMGGNRLSEVPSTLGQLKALQALVLCDNMLESLPSSIANLTRLKSLLLHKNSLRTLPTEIIKLKCLTEVSPQREIKKTNLTQRVVDNDVFIFQLSLRDNPLVVRFVSDMTHDPPSLLELAARVVKTNDIRYDDQDVPRNLLEYLDSAHRCVNPKCKGVFQVEISPPLLLRLTDVVSLAQVSSSTTTWSTSSSSTSAASIACRCCSICAAANASSHVTATRSSCAAP